MEVDRLGEHRDQQRLRQARHPLKQQVAAGKKRDQQPLHNHILADHHSPNSLADVLDELERLGRDQAGALLDAIVV